MSFNPVEMLTMVLNRLRTAPHANAAAIAKIEEARSILLHNRGSET